MEKTENKPYQLDDRMRAIYEDMVGGPDFGNIGMSPEMREYCDKRRAEMSGKAEIHNDNIKKC